MRGSTTKLSCRTSPRRVFATVWMSAPSKFISTPSPVSATPSREATRSLGSRLVGAGADGSSVPGKRSGCEDCFDWVDRSLCAGKRGLRSALLTASIGSPCELVWRPSNNLLLSCEAQPVKNSASTAVAQALAGRKKGCRFAQYTGELPPKSLRSREPLLLINYNPC